MNTTNSNKKEINTDGQEKERCQIHTLLKKHGFNHVPKDNLKSKILLLTYIHGNEPIGIKLVKNLIEEKGLRENFNWVIGNVEASLVNKRFINFDINRESPGDTNSEEYELRRAAELSKLVSKYDYVIDIHQTRANSRSIIILPNLNSQSLSLALALNVKNILLWPSNMNTGKGPVILNTPYGIGFEIGTRSGYTPAIKRNSKILANFLTSKEKLLPVELTNSKLKRRSFYLVGDKIDPDDVKNLQLKDFGEIIIRGIKFKTLLFGRHKKILGYLMRSLTIDDLKLLLTRS